MDLNLGKKLKHFRNEKGYTLKQLSELSGVSISFISDIENGRRNPSIDTLQSLADSLSISVNVFFDKNTQSKKEKNKTSKEELAIIPKEFIDADEARSYLSKHQIFASEGFELNKLTDKEVLEFANALLEQMKLVGYKYKK